MRGSSSAVGVLVTALAIGACSANSSSSKQATASGAFTVFLTTELRGNIEPCGCTSDPMGDLARTAALIDTARKGGGAVLYLDGGSMLYQSTGAIAKHLENQEALKAELLLASFAEQLHADAVGLGPYDLAKGAGAVRPARQAANLPAGSGIATEPPKVVEAGGVKVGIFGVVAPEVLTAYGIEVGDPTAAAKQAVADLRANGARVVIGLAHMRRREAAQLAAHAPGIDILLVGQNAPEPKDASNAPAKVGDTWLVRPANRGQVVTRLDVTIKGAGPLADAIGEARAAIEIASLDQQITELRANLEAWAKDDSADPAFIATKKKELTDAIARRDTLKKSPTQVPAKGSWFVMTQVAIRKALPCDSAVQAAKLAYDKQVGDANVKAAAGSKPPAPATGKAAYVGAEECSYCHKKAVTFWKGTKHADAWETLEKLGKQFNYDCTGCHVTGWLEPGGSNLARNEHLRDVQCEQCHGPGSIHVDEDGKEKPSTMIRLPRTRVCKGCHTPEHSDTFERDAYLRDITGVGHGATFRAQLGDGETGEQLRSAALKKAGGMLGAGCEK